MEKFSPLLGASTVSLADDCRPPFDLCRLMYSPLTSRTIQGAPHPAIDNRSSFARWDLPEPFLPVIMFRPPSSPLASTLIASPSLCPSFTGIFQPFIINRLIAYDRFFYTIRYGSNTLIGHSHPHSPFVNRILLQDLLPYFTL